MLCYVDPNEKKEVSFGTWIAKRGFTRSEVEDKIFETHGMSLPEEYWIVDKSKSKRAVKTVSTSSDDEGSVEGEKSAQKKRGRPKKVKADEASLSDGVSVVAEETTPSSVSEKPIAKKVKPVKKRVVKKEVVPVIQDEPELTEEPVSDQEPANEEPAHEEPVEEEPAHEEPVEEEPAHEEPVEEEPAHEENKDGKLEKLSTDHTLVWWGGKSYVIDNDDNCVWSYEGEDYELVACVGEWNPESRTLEFDS